MKHSLRAPRAVVLCVLLLASAIGIGIVVRNLAAGHHSEASLMDISGLEPGDQERIRVGGNEVIISVPEGEGFSIGTMKIEIPDIGFASPAIERDGSLESVWITDVNGDRSDDAVFVIRSAGSGSYAGIIVLESAGKSFHVRKIPVVSAMPGYMGHEQISVKGRTIRCSFPTYIDRSAIRIDKQWELDDGLAGELPIKKGADSNADPSGATEYLEYDYSAHKWRVR